MNFQNLTPEGETTNISLKRRFIPSHQREQHGQIYQRSTEQASDISVGAVAHDGDAAAEKK
jgi:hypothetical protein